MGGNDVGFASVLMRCVVSPVAALCPSDKTLRNRIASKLEDPYRNFLRQVASDAVTYGGNVVVLGYPELIENPARPCRWRVSGDHADVARRILQGEAPESATRLVRTTRVPCPPEH